MSLLTENATAEIILKKGKTAPFDGILVEEKLYRGYVANEFEIKSLKEDLALTSTQLEGIEKKQTSLVNDDGNNRADFFLGGIILGILGTLLAVK